MRDTRGRTGGLVAGLGLVAVGWMCVRLNPAGHEDAAAAWAVLLPAGGLLAACLPTGGAAGPPPRRGELGGILVAALGLGLLIAVLTAAGHGLGGALGWV